MSDAVERWCNARRDSEASTNEPWLTPDTNVEGLTWEEWACAASTHVEFAMYHTVHDLYRWRARWAAGEDPSEWRNR